MVARYLTAHLDYISFLYGFSLILLSVAAQSMARATHGQRHWRWLFAFGLLHALSEWADMIALSLDDPPAFRVARLLLLAVSFASLMAFSLGALGILKRAPWLRWVAPAAGLLGLLGLCDGLDGFGATVRYAFGFGGAGLSAWVLWIMALHPPRRSQRTLAAMAVTMAAYAVVAGVVVRPAAFFPASSINEASFLAAFGTPVQLVRCLLALALAGGTWQIGRQLQAGDLAASTMAILRGERWLWVALPVALAIGWAAADAAGTRTVRHAEQQLSDVCAAAAAGISPEHVAELKGNASDAGTEALLRVQTPCRQLVNSVQNVRYVYLAGRRGRDLFFFTDTEPDALAGTGPALAQPGERYRDAPAGLRRCFETGKPIVDGPYSDAWGRFLSAYTPIREGGKGRILAALGVDVDSGRVDLLRLRARLETILITMLFCGLLLSVAVAWQRSRSGAEERMAGSERVRRQQQAALALATSPVLAHGEWESAAREITVAAARELDATRAGLWVGDASGEAVVCAGYYDSGDYVGTPAGHRLVTEACPAFFDALAEGGPVEAARLAEDERTAQLPGCTDWIADDGALLATPVRASGRFKGVLILTRGADAGPWRQDEVRFAGEMADQAAQVMLNAQRRATERRLAETLDLNRKITAAAALGIGVCRATGPFIYANAALAGITGDSEREILTQDFRLAESWKRSGLTVLAEKAIESGSMQNAEVRLPARDGREVWLDSYLTPFTSGGEPHLLIMVNDVTLRRRAEEEMRQAHAELERRVAERTAELSRANADLRAEMLVRQAAEQALNESRDRMQQTQKLESLGVLAGGIAHDFNNLLVAILGNIDMSLAELPSDSPSRPCLEDAIKASRRAADLCRQMLAYSGKGRFAVEVADLNAIIGDMLQIIEVSVSKKVQIHRRLGAGLPPFRVDVSQIRQVIMNLVINASEAIGDRTGVITVATSAGICDRHYLASTWLRQDLPSGLYVCLEVTDDGCGMDEATQARIFDPFFTTKFTGRGLGLAAVLGIVRAHRGAIEVNSQPGQGSVFRVFFPAADPGAVVEQQAEPVVDSWRGEGTVLIVDDEPAVLAAGQRMVERLGFSVVTASNGRLGLDLLASERQRIACVILDLLMPEMDGAETLRELRRRDSNVPVLMASGYPEQTVRDRLSGHSVSGFIQKPFDLQALTSRLKSALAGNNTIS